MPRCLGDHEFRPKFSQERKEAKPASKAMSRSWFYNNNNNINNNNKSNSNIIICIFFLYIILYVILHILLYIILYIILYTIYTLFFALYIISQRLQRYLYCYMLYELYDFYAVIPAYNGWISLLDAACPVHWWSCQKNREKKTSKDPSIFWISWSIELSPCKTESKQQNPKTKQNTQKTPNTKNQHGRWISWLVHRHLKRTRRDDNIVSP